MGPRRCRTRVPAPGTPPARYTPGNAAALLAAERARATASRCGAREHRKADRLQAAPVAGQRMTSNVAARGTNFVSPSFAVASTETCQVPSARSAASCCVTFRV